MHKIHKNKELNLLSIKNFYYVNTIDRLKINDELEYNYSKYFNILNGYNYPILEYNNLFFKNLYNEFLKICHDIFGNFSLSMDNKTTCWCYKSFENQYDSIFHDHINTSTINGVFYYQTNLEDSISFLHNNNEILYPITQNELLIFPNYLIHKPNKPKGNICRYSINIEITTKEKVDELFIRI